MKFLQKIGLVKQDEIVEPLPKGDRQAAVPTTTAFGTVFQQPAVQSPVSSKTDYNKHLEEVLDRNNQPGFDFLEFHKILSGLDNKPLAEQQKYETAFVSAQAMGISAKNLAQSGKTYLGVLDKEEAEFNAELNSANQKVEAKKQEMQRLADQNADLMKQIEANNKKSQELNMEVLDSTNGLGIEKQSFEFALINKRGLLSDRLAKIQQYCNDTTK